MQRGHHLSIGAGLLIAGVGFTFNRVNHDLNEVDAALLAVIFAAMFLWGGRLAIHKEPS